MVAFVRPMRENGRVMIPREIREVMGWDHDTAIEIIPLENGVFFRTYRPQPVNLPSGGAGPKTKPDDPDR